MFDDRLLLEANRQFAICNACRFCEGVCSVFPAMELRTAFQEGDVGYLSSLCHDCGACLEACPFSPPHEFAVDIPSVMEAARLETFEFYARPQPLWRLMTRPLAPWVTALIGIGLLTLLAVFEGTPHLLRPHHGRDSFYAVIPYVWLVVPGLLLGLATVGATAAGTYRFVRGKSEVTLPPVTLATLFASIKDAAILRNLSGGGGGCRTDEARRPTHRRALHHAVGYGFALMFLSTVAAGIEQDILGIRPPYPYLSVPVVLGVIGGVAACVGCIGFLKAGAAGSARKSTAVRGFDSRFTVLLLAATASGLLTLICRTTPVIAPVLIVHLGLVSALFVAFPYGKFVHASFRLAALARSDAERRADRPRQHVEPQLSPVSLPSSEG